MLRTDLADELHWTLAIVVVEHKLWAVPGDQVDVDAVLVVAVVVGLIALPGQVAGKLLAAETAPTVVTLAT